jgi:hypothetical protein
LTNSSGHPGFKRNMFFKCKRTLKRFFKPKMDLKYVINLDILCQESRSLSPMYFLAKYFSQKHLTLNFDPIERIM